MVNAWGQSWGVTWATAWGEIPGGGEVPEIAPAAIQALLTDTYSLRRAWVATSPEYPTDLLPILYGNLSGGTGGISYCPGIIQETFTYLIADHAIVSALNGNAPTFYADGIVTMPASWDATATVAGRTCATVTFSESHAGQRIGYRGKGAASGGALITNPVSVVEHFLTTFVGVPTSNFEATALAEAKAKANKLEYVCAGVLDLDRAPGTTISEILSCFGGYYYINPIGQIVIVIDDGLTPDIAGIPDNAAIRAHEFETSEATWTLGTIVNQCAVSYSRNNYDIALQQRFQDTDDGAATLHAASQQLYGARGPGLTEAALEWPWVRETASVQAAQSVIVKRLGMPRARIRVSSPSFRLVHLDVGDHVLFSWPRLFDEYQRPIVNQIGLIEEIAVDGDEPRVDLTIRDTGNYLSRAYPANGDYLSDGTIQAGSERDQRDY